MDTTIEKCPHCGASMKAYWHKLTPGLVGTLVKVYTKVNEKNANRVHKKELVLNHSEYGNFQKLRFHGLIAKYKEGGVWKSGDWLITRRGGDFLRGEIQVPAAVKTFRNRVIAHDEQLITVKGALGVEPFFEENFNFSFIDLPENTDYEAGVAQKKPKKKKGKHYCPKCETELVKKQRVEPGRNPNSVFVTSWYECTECDYKSGEL